MITLPTGLPVAASSGSSSGFSSLPVWGQTLLAILAFVIVLTLIWVVVEAVRWMTTGPKPDEQGSVEVEADSPPPA
ncbi:MAG TPA: hypothetical protein VMF35_06505 [Acidimicrobiales bacterium]|nr:hypothetical protein [Acidimicrobiales bacterium]